MQVKDIMSSDVVAVFPATSVKEVATLLTEKKIHGVPVVDEEKKVIGIITETNFFAKVNGDLYLSSVVKSISVTKLPDVSDLNQKNEIGIETTARDIMTENCVTVEAEMEIEDLFEVFRRKGFHTVPVVKADKTLVGIVTLADIIAISTKINKAK